MRLFSRNRRKISEGERARALAFLLVGVCSAGLGYLAVLHLDRAAFFSGLSGYQQWIVVASGLGGMVALFLSGDRMGQPGPVGAMRACACAIWVTFIGALIGHFYFKRKMGLRWRQYIPVVSAGFACGMGLITTVGVGITFLSKAAIQLPF